MSLVLTNRCNASCLHCSTSCGPDRTDSLTRAQIFSAMDQAAAIPSTDRLAFFLTGGELFLDLPLLEAVVRHGAGLGALVTCVTNAYWASSDEKARAILTRLKHAGLGSFAVSTSRFHQQFVKRSRVQRALSIGRELGITCALKYVRHPSDDLNTDEIREWATAAGATEVEDFTLLPYLRDGEMLDETSYVRTEGLPEGTCPSQILTVREDGNSFSCCTPGAYTPLLSLGNLSTDSLSDLRDRFYLGEVQSILREEGPASLAREVIRRGHGSRLRDRYTNVCDLCTHLMNDAQCGGAVRDIAASAQVRKLSQIVRSVLPPSPPLSSTTTLQETSHV